MNWIIILGLTASLFTTVAFLPQVIKSLKTKKTRDISLGMYVILSIGIALWISYGILIKDIPIIVANSISFLFSIIILFRKIRT